MQMDTWESAEKMPQRGRWTQSRSRSSSVLARRPNPIKIQLPVNELGRWVTEPNFGAATALVCHLIKVNVSTKNKTRPPAGWLRVTDSTDWLEWLAARIKFRFVNKFHALFNFQCKYPVSQHLLRLTTAFSQGARGKGQGAGGWGQGAMGNVRQVYFIMATKATHICTVHAECVSIWGTCENVGKMPGKCHKWQPKCHEINLKVGFSLAQLNGL